MKKLLPKRKYFPILYFCTSILLLFLIGGFYPQLCKDSDMYYNQVLTIGVMPLYPLFLKLCFLLGGAVWQFQIAVFLQTFLSAFTITWFILYIREAFQLNLLTTMICFVFAHLPYLICTPELKIAQAIMTEGIAFPLFYLYMLFLLRGIIEKKRIFLFISFGLSYLLALTRSQLQLAVLFSAACFFYTSLKMYLHKGMKPGKVIFTLFRQSFFSGCFLFLVLFAVSYTTKAYEYCFFHSTSGAQSSNALLGRTVYDADLNDTVLFHDPDVREIYQNIYQASDANEYRFIYSRNDLWKWKDISKSSNEIAKIGVTIAEDYARNELHLIDDNAIHSYRSDVLGQIGSSLLRAHWKEYLRDSLYLLPQGFIATVFFQKDAVYGLCHLATLLLYLGAFFLMLFSFVKKQTNKALIEFAAVVVLFAALNVLATNLIFYSVQRYLVYTYGLFYIACFLLFCDCIKAIRS